MWLQNFLPTVLPESIQQQTAYDIFTRHTMVFSNVPGPTNSLFLCNQRVEGFQIIFPNLIPQCLLISYNDGIFFNMVIDEEQSPGAFEELPLYYLDELKQLAAAYDVDSKDVLIPGRSISGIFGLASP